MPADYSRSQSCEYISGLSLNHKDYQERGWVPQYIWGLDIDHHVITKMLTERLGQQGFALELVEGDLYKIWAPSQFGEIDFASCKKASRTRAKVLKPKVALVNRL